MSISDRGELIFKKFKWYRRDSNPPVPDVAARSAAGQACQHLAAIFYNIFNPLSPITTRV